MKKIQVVISEKNYARFLKVSKLKRSMLVDYALTRLFQSNETTDVSIVAFIEEREERHPTSPLKVEERRERPNLGGLADED